MTEEKSFCLKKALRLDVFMRKVNIIKERIEDSAEDVSFESLREAVSAAAFDRHDVIAYTQCIVIDATDRGNPHEGILHISLVAREEKGRMYVKKNLILMYLSLTLCYCGKVYNEILEELK